ERDRSPRGPEPCDQWVAGGLGDKHRPAESSSSGWWSRKKRPEIKETEEGDDRIWGLYVTIGENLTKSMVGAPRARRFVTSL
ncbi:unnamed protein product, partial [Musa acuminata subsp. burmannicoides]